MNFCVLGLAPCCLPGVWRHVRLLWSWKNISTPGYRDRKSKWEVVLTLLWAQSGEYLLL
jgi:hypothetical protein